MSYTLVKKADIGFTNVSEIDAQSIYKTGVLRQEQLPGTIAQVLENCRGVPIFAKFSDSKLLWLLPSLIAECFPEKSHLVLILFGKS